MKASLSQSRSLSSNGLQVKPKLHLNPEPFVQRSHSKHSKQSRIVLDAVAKRSPPSAPIPIKYVPRRDLPTSTHSKSPSPKGEKYSIIDREPGEDRIPRYILRRIVPTTISADHKFTPPPLLRVSLFDIDSYVSVREIDRYENDRFERQDPEYSSQRQWAKTVRAAKREDRDLYRSNPAVRVDVKCSRDPLSHFSEDRSLGEIIGPHEKRQKTSSSDAILDGRNHGHWGTPRAISTVNSKGLTSSWHPLPFRTPPIPEPLEKMDLDDVEYYEVSRICDHKDVLGVRHYLVKWMGYSDEQATWLTEDELVDAAGAMRDYYSRMDIEGYQPMDRFGRNVVDSSPSVEGGSTSEAEDELDRR
jgi:hypothetical protein